MKHNRLRLRAALLAATTVASMALASLTQAATPQDPTLEYWDCAISGAGQKGLATIVFNGDGTFTGYQILTANPKATSSSTTATRGTEDTDYGRTSSGRSSGSSSSSSSSGSSSSTTVVSRTNWFGFGQVSGPWRYDIKGRVVGFFTAEIGGEGEEAEPIIEGVSFIAKVTPHKRITLTAYTSLGTITYSGTPAKDVADMSGGWYATKIKNKQKFQEFFTLDSFAVDNPLTELYPDLMTYPNIYFTSDGTGPGYSFLGAAMFSARKQAAFVFQSTPTAATNTSLSATYGPYSIRKSFTKAATSGAEEPYTAISYTATLSAW